MAVSVMAGAVGEGEGTWAGSVGAGGTGEVGDWCQAHALVPGSESKNAIPVAANAINNEPNPRPAREDRGILSKEGNRPL